MTVNAQSGLGPDADRSSLPVAPQDGTGTRPAAGTHGQSPTPLWARTISTFFGIGRLKLGPGTWASIATVVLWAAACSVIPESNRTIAGIVAASVATLIGIPASTRIVRTTGIKDPSFVVIDEVAGQLVALIAVPLSWKTFLVGLILFRIFDILKPFPIRQLEHLPDGIGIMMDDLGAGILALMMMHLFMHFGLLIR